MNTSVTRLDGTRTILSLVSHGIGRAVSRCLFPRRRKCQRRNREGVGRGRGWTRCRPTLSAVSPVPSALKGRGPRLVKAPKTRLMPDPLRDGSWEGGVAKFQRETRFGISEFSGEGKLWRRMEFHRGRIELSGISDERTGS